MFGVASLWDYLSGYTPLRKDVERILWFLGLLNQEMIEQMMNQFKIPNSK
jgi:hypothetical protein